MFFLFNLLLLVVAAEAAVVVVVAAIGARQHCVTKICNASQRANGSFCNLCALALCLDKASSLAGVTYLRYTVLTSPNEGETAVHCCDPPLSGLVMLVSRNVVSRSISLAVFCLIPFFGLIRSLADTAGWQRRLSYAVPRS